MKKLITLSALALVLGGMSAFAGEPAGYQITTPNSIRTNGGEFPLAISPNGQYICGSSYSHQGFVYDMSTKTTKLSSDWGRGGVSDQGANEFLAVSNTGVAVGFDVPGAVAADFNGSAITLEGLFGDNIIANDITADGSLIVGFMATFYEYKPCIWTPDGKATYLPVPSNVSMESQYDLEKVYGIRATRVSNDGSIILGYIEERMHSRPMVYWKRQADGSYQFVPAFLEWANPKNTYIYNEAGTEVIGWERSDKPYIQFCPDALSGDGNLVAMFLQPNEDVLLPQFKLGIYNIATKELKVIDKSSLLARAEEFQVTGITNDGAVVGILGNATAYNSIPFYMSPDGTVETFFTKWPELDVVETMQLDSSGVNIVAGCTPDGRYITGYYFDDIDFDPVAWVIYTGVGEDSFGENNGDNGVDAVLGEEDNTNPVYYTIDGVKVQNPDKGGIYIKKVGGKATKVIL